MIRLAVRVQREHAELVLAELLELAPGGLEEVSEGDCVEFAVYGAPGELPSLPDLRAAAGDALVEIATSELPDGWDERWRRFHQPVVISSPRTRSPHAEAVGAVRVLPPWHGARDDASGGAHDIVIDPGQAFGTGAHATTRQCLELLLALSAADGAAGALLDLGTGSGVLAIAAARLGYRPVIAVDNEYASVQSARANALANGVAITVRRADVRDGSALGALIKAGHGDGGVVVANLIGPLLLELATRLPFSPAHLIAGGMLPEQLEPVRFAFAKRTGLRQRERRQSDGWGALWLSRA